MSELRGWMIYSWIANHGSAIFGSTIAESVLATLALLLDSGVNRKILHDPRPPTPCRASEPWTACWRCRTNRNSAKGLDLWHPAFRSLASNLLTGLQSTRYWKKQAKR